jgi:XTP/dITP diphosphohydrolase
MKNLIFATANPYKIREVNAMLGGDFNIKNLKDIGCREDIPETSPTIEGNALQKARYVAENYGVDCFSEDTGLEVKALHGAPGVSSARYAGPARDSEANIDLLLRNLASETDRRARFRTVIALIMNGREYTFEGIVEGHIAPQRKGERGFGYDPVFIPEGYERSFAEMSAGEKNAISHRARAIRQLVDFLRSRKH